jgi:hypothetical protein
MGGHDRRAELLARTEDGVLALVELLGGDPAAPRMRALPGRLTEYLLSLAPAVADPAGPEPAPPSGRGKPEPPEQQDALAAAAGRRHAKVAALLEPLDPSAVNPAPERYPFIATTFIGICDMHLARVVGTVSVAHDGGDVDGHAEGHAGAHWLSRTQLDWLIGVMATGLVSERHLAEQLVYALRRHTGSAGCAVLVHALRPCQSHHAEDGALCLDGTFLSGPLREQFVNRTGAHHYPADLPPGN